MFVKLSNQVIAQIKKFKRLFLRFTHENQVSVSLNLFFLNIDQCSVNISHHQYFQVWLAKSGCSLKLPIKCRQGMTTGKDKYS